MRISDCTLKLFQVTKKAGFSTHVLSDICDSNKNTSSKAGQPFAKTGQKICSYVALMYDTHPGKNEFHVAGLTPGDLGPARPPIMCT